MIDILISESCYFIKLVNLSHCFIYRYLQYSLNPEKIKAQDTSRVLTNVANYNPNGRQLAWQFLKLNWDFIIERLVLQTTLQCMWIATFRSEYENGIEYEYDFQISNQLNP